MKVGLRMEDALCLSKWSVSVNKIAARLRWIWPLSLVRILPGGNHWCLSLCCFLGCSETLRNVQYFSIHNSIVF